MRGSLGVSVMGHSNKRCVKYDVGTPPRDCQHRQNQEALGRLKGRWRCVRIAGELGGWWEQGAAITEDLGFCDVKSLADLGSPGQG